MKIIKQSCSIFDPEGKMSPLERIEYIARVCHNSQDMMKPGGSLKFLQTLWDMGHGSVFEHAYVHVPLEIVDRFIENAADRVSLYGADARQWSVFKGTKYSRCMNCRDFLAQGGTFKELQSLAPVTRGFVTIEVTTDRGVSHQLVRHRQLSFTQASTRYIDYSKPGNDLAVIEPEELSAVDGNTRATWEQACENSCRAYTNLIGCGVLPEVARSVLPTAFATKLYITGTYDALKHMLELRTAKSALPQIRQLLQPLADFMMQEMK